MRDCHVGGHSIEAYPKEAIPWEVIPWEVILRRFDGDHCLDYTCRCGISVHLSPS